MAAGVPKQLATPEETFQALAVQFNFSNRIKDKIIELGLRTLAEFRFYCQTEDEVRRFFVDSLQPAMSEGESRLQTARIRFAWTACKSLLEQEQTVASQPSPPEEEEQLLPATELDALKEAFYKRYHIKPTPAKFPGDRLISKMVKSLGRGQLEVFDLWSVRSLVHQRTHGAKRRRLAENIFIHEEDKDEQAPRNWLNYLDKLETYLYALAIAGVQPLAPAPATPETLATGSTPYIRVPLDILLTYFSRCQEVTRHVPESKRLGLLMHLDTQERAVWSARMTGGTALGSLIESIMREREALWIAGTIVQPAPDSSRPANTPAVSGGEPLPGPKPGLVGSLRDGTLLCPDYQVGRCRERNCTKGQHRCGFLQKSGRVCGSWQHAGNRCPHDRKG